MAGFGSELRRLRLSAGLRQADLVEVLERVIARSTLASVESGRELPSPRLWAAIGRALPTWVEELQPLFEAARGTQPAEDAGSSLLQTPLAGAFALEEARYIYTWRDHEVPEEIVEVRRVRALRDGEDAYVLRLKTDAETSEMDTEVLWGGRIDDSLTRHLNGRTLFLHRFVFDRPLRRGEVFTFGLRSWVSREDDPQSSVALRYTIPIVEASLHFNFLGRLPGRVWRFGPLADEGLAKDDEVVSAGVIEPVGRSVSSYFAKPALAACYGMGWDW